MCFLCYYYWANLQFRPTGKCSLHFVNISSFILKILDLLNFLKSSPNILKTNCLWMVASKFRPRFCKSSLTKKNWKENILKAKYELHYTNTIYIITICYFIFMDVKNTLKLYINVWSKFSFSGKHKWGFTW